MKKQRKETAVNKILISAIAVLLLFIVFCTIVFIRSNRPLSQAKKEAVAMAKKYTDLDTVDKFYWYNRDKVYFTVTGESDKGQDMIVIVPKSGDKIRVLSPKDGITEAEAKKQVTEAHKGESVTKVTIGIHDNEPVWEVVTQNTDGTLAYYLLSFAKGEEVKAIKDL